ncbi:hypothetical protein NEIFLAOT_01887 [Neisseria flavescens NRL30031/H210]|uniref:Uncharacterized protein n=1 Tax=Neisseria flavescens NRL30031/H210 TaxID=546264 RepID=C0EPJ7_NEIFL|nr:hypothetical protein NEIFLAOT_01887 [Neisseria flavescens NRL30031/H210]
MYSVFRIFSDGLVYVYMENKLLITDMLMQVLCLNRFFKRPKKLVSLELAFVA